MKNFSYDPDYDWIYDLVIEIISSPEFRNPIKDFIDENCDTFVGTEENSLEQGKIFKNFVTFIDNLLENYLKEIGISDEMFILAAKKGIENPKNKIHKKYILQLISFTNYLYFKNLMTKRNLQLEQQALKLLNENNLKINVNDNKNKNIKNNNNKNKNDNLNNVEKIIENNINLVEEEEIKKLNKINENEIKKAILNNQKMKIDDNNNKNNNDEINKKIQTVNFSKNSELNEIRNNIKKKENQERENNINKSEILNKKNTLRKKLQDNLTKLDRIKFAIENNLKNNISNNNNSNNNENNNNNSDNNNN